MSSENKLAQPGTDVVPLQHQKSLDSAERSVGLNGTVAVQNSSFETSAPPATQLDISEPNEPEEDVYPTGPKVYLAVGALYTAFFLNGLVSNSRFTKLMRRTEFKYLGPYHCSGSCPKPDLLLSLHR